MHRIRPHLGLTLSVLAGATIGTGSFLAWRYVLAPDLDWWWALLLIAGGTSLLLLSVAADVWRRHQARGRTHRRHARPHHVRKAIR